MSFSEWWNENAIDMLAHSLGCEYGKLKEIAAAAYNAGTQEAKAEAAKANQQHHEMCWELQEVQDALDQMGVSKEGKPADRVRMLGYDAAMAGVCPHLVDYKSKSCVICFGDGTEVLSHCDKCKALTYHRGGKCLKCEEAPTPYDLIARLTAENENLKKECEACHCLMDECFISAGYNPKGPRPFLVQMVKDLVQKAREYEEATEKGYKCLNCGRSVTGWGCEQCDQERIM